MPSFANVYITARVRASLNRVVQTQQQQKFWELVSKLKDGKFEIPGLNVEKLRGKTSKLFSARLNREMRLIFSMQKEQSGNSLIIHEVNHHDAAYERAERLRQSAEDLEDAAHLIATSRISIESSGQDLSKSSDISAELNAMIEEGVASLLPVQLFKVPYYLLSEPDKYLQFEKSLDRYLILSEEQEEILSLRERALLVQGAAGTGKTTLALFKALYLFEENPDDAVYLFTYHEELACVCRSYTVNLMEQEAEEENASGIKVFSYLDFCRRYLRNNLSKKDKEKNWIEKQKSIEIIRSILIQKQRWTRKFQAEELYGLFYSILKGRFMPGTESLPGKKEDYERIFRDYGKAPEDLEETLEIFSLYQSKLERSGSLDEADIIRLSYETLKRKAVLAEVERIWIVIDEVQDFSELEWKSILLFWESNCKHRNHPPSYPFLSGDVNQNISKSGFRWQELESYLQGILKNLRRPSALKKITLHQNYRNTKQIHNLASFIRKMGGDSGDLGLCPETDGEIPVLAVADDQELLRFLKSKSSEEESGSPLVVLVEDDDSLRFLQKELSGSQSVFLLSLRASKGMEFEDVIIHRAFSSVSKISSSTKAELSRFFDLWYMGISRARKSLLMLQNREDAEALAEFLADRCAEFKVLSREMEAKSAFEDFCKNLEAQMPNYNVIFLERQIASQLWQEFIESEKEGETAGAASPADCMSDNKSSLAYGEKCKNRAIALWRRCFDYTNLAKALMHLNEFEESAFYFKRAGMHHDAALCLESCELYADAAFQYEKSHKSGEAARCHEYAGEFSKAAQLYERLGDWALAAQNYHNEGNLSKAALACEKAGMFRSAAEIHRIRGKYQRAAELFEQVEDFNNAADMYLKIKDKLDAARCFHKASNFKKSVELFEALNRYSEAAETARAGGMQARAGSLFLKAGRLLESARAFEEAGLHENAANIYQRVKEYPKAATCYEQSGKADKAARMYELSGDWQKALLLSKECGDDLLEARCLEKSGNFAGAADIFIKNSYHSEAASCLEKNGDLMKASEFYLKGGQPLQAARCLAQINHYLEAAKLLVAAAQNPQAYEMIMSGTRNSKIQAEADFKQLLDWCIAEKRVAASAKLLELKKDYSAAAEKYKECMMLDRAADCLEKWGQPSEAAKLYEESGDLKAAAQCFKKSRLYQQAGACFEKLQDWSEAKKMYEICKDENGVARCNRASKWL